MNTFVRCDALPYAVHSSIWQLSVLLALLMSLNTWSGFHAEEGNVHQGVQQTLLELMSNVHQSRVCCALHPGFEQASSSAMHMQG